MNFMEERRLLGDTGELETWVEWQIRTMRNAGRIINCLGASVLERLEHLKTRWAGHIARMGCKHRQPHVLKSLVLLV